MNLSRYRWKAKQDSDIAVIEGLSAEPPQREVAMELDTIMKNMVRRRIAEKEERMVHGEGAEGGGEEQGGEQEGESGGEQEGDQGITGGEESQMSGDQGNSTQMSEVERAHRDFEKEERERKKRKRKRQKETGIEGKIIPNDLLRRLAALWSKFETPGEEASEIVAAFYVECGVDLDDVILSPATAQRSKVEEALLIKEKVEEEFKNKVVGDNIKLTLHYDTKLMNQRMAGRRSQLERLALVVSAPELERPQLLSVLGLEGGTALVQATAAHGALVDSGLLRYVIDLVYDTTAVNTGRMGGTVRLLQDMAGTTMSNSPCRRFVTTIFKTNFLIPFFLSTLEDFFKCLFQTRG